MRWLLIILFLSLASAAEEWVLYHAPGDDAAALTAQVQPYLPDGVELRLCALADEAHGAEALRQHAAAMADGVHELPCLALGDADGVYALLPLRSLCPQALEQARSLSAAPDRARQTQRRKLLAEAYTLAAELADAPPDAQEALVAKLHKLVQQPATPDDLRQFIGLHILYPAIMRQYAAGYTGAHTPLTEAKLLEGIGVLEYVRDLAPTSQLGRKAHDERERMRAARLKSRQYE